MLQLWRYIVVLMIISTLASCALTDPWRKAKYNHLKPLELDTAASIWATVMGQTHAKETRGGVESYVAYWSPELMIPRAEALAARGITNAPIPNSGYDYEYLSAKPEKLESLFSGRLDFSEYIGHSEIAIIAKVKQRSDRGNIFDLDVLHRFKGFNVPEQISITNNNQGHFGKITDDLSHHVKDGQVCLFFLSPTYTKYRQEFSLETSIEDQHLMLEAFPRFCEQSNGHYAYSKTGQGEPLLTRRDILELYPPIKKDTTRPTYLKRTNSIALRGEWDILKINNDAFSRPYGTLSINQHNDIRISCGSHSYAGDIINGKFVSKYPIENLKSCREKNSFSNINLSQNYLEGTFYADRKTLWFDGPDISYIAKRSDKPPSTYGWNEWYKYLSVEACVLDHPNIGADKYAGLGWFGASAPQVFKFAFVGDGESYWEDCKPDYPVEVTTVDYSLPLLNAQVYEVKKDIAKYDQQYITGGWLHQQINSIVVSIDPDWAPDNQDIIKALKEKHPYIEWREDLPFDEIIVTAH